ncbi:hypothetical protein NDU88_002717 [Pleurodeles waltl]|uniref:Uncharacterized protein n=1 Tax=Pleurodeles waltl TaxID=8319 RepID=A0AAV7P9W4_PLEWA|nr:hypothetical protein NDU88_002717 [Pleurodeles waltl]
MIWFAQWPLFRGGSSLSAGSLGPPVYRGGRHPFHPKRLLASAAVQTRESPLERCASLPGPRLPDSRGAGRREVPARRRCCFRAWGARTSEPGPGSPHGICSCLVHGARLVRTAPPRGGLSPGPSALRVTRSGSARGGRAGKPVLSHEPGRAPQADPPSWFSLCLCRSGRVQRPRLGAHHRRPQRVAESSGARGSTQGDF